MRVLAIDPGPARSAFLVYDSETNLPVRWEIRENADVLWAIDANSGECDSLAVEMIASYGMAVSASVFDTCVWIGRFMERWMFVAPNEDEPTLVFRIKAKMHLCHDSRAKDANIRAALIDRFGGKDRAIGLKASPGPLYGMSGDCWAALAVAITAVEHPEYAQLTLKEEVS